LIRKPLDVRFFVMRSQKNKIGFETLGFILFLFFQVLYCAQMQRRYYIILYLIIFVVNKHNRGVRV
jgi:hypothetical protein